MYNAVQNRRYKAACLGVEIEFNYNRGSNVPIAHGSYGTNSLLAYYEQSIGAVSRQSLCCFATIWPSLLNNALLFLPLAKSR